MKLGENDEKRSNNGNASGDSPSTDSSQKHTDQNGNYTTNDEGTEKNESNNDYDSRNDAMMMVVNQDRQKESDSPPNSGGDGSTDGDEPGIDMNY